MSGKIYNGIDELVENDPTSFEYYNGLPQQVRTQLLDMDITTFSELCSAADRVKRLKI
ncbi:MAG: hypothetical protein ACI4KM_06065 [Oscillospiraceae bacterium]